MKKYLLLMTLLSSVNAFAGFSIDCKYIVDKTKNSVYGEGSNVGVFISEIDGFECQGLGKLKRNKYFVEFFGIGPSLRIDVAERMLLTCPTVRKDKIEQSYYGVKLTAGALVGGDAGVVFSKGLGTCLFTGLGLSAGGSVTIGEMSISKIK